MFFIKSLSSFLEDSIIFLQKYYVTKSKYIIFKFISVSWTKTQFCTYSIAIQLPNYTNDKQLPSDVKSHSGVSFIGPFPSNTVPRYNIVNRLNHRSTSTVIKPVAQTANSSPTQQKFTTEVGAGRYKRYSKTRTFMVNSQSIPLCSFRIN